MKSALTLLVVSVLIVGMHLGIFMDQYAERKYAGYPVYHYPVFKEVFGVRTLMWCEEIRFDDPKDYVEQGGYVIPSLSCHS